MNKGAYDFKEVLKRGLLSISILAVSALYMVINQYTGREKELITFIDGIIPFNKYFVYAYVYWYVYVTAFVIYFCIRDDNKFYKILIGLNAGMIISYFIYIVFPTTVPRPVFIPDGDLASRLLLNIYNSDNPYNCFPSLHVLNTLIIAIYVQKDELLNKYIKIGSIISAGLIIYSTFAIKQHVILDAVSAAFIAYGIYGVLDYREIRAKVREIYKVLEQRL